MGSRDQHLRPHLACVTVWLSSSHFWGPSSWNIPSCYHASFWFGNTVRETCFFWGKAAVRAVGGGGGGPSGVSCGTRLWLVSTSRVQRLPPHSCRRTHGFIGLFISLWGRGGAEARRGHPACWKSVGEPGAGLRCQPHFTVPPGPGLSLREGTARGRSARPLRPSSPACPRSEGTGHPFPEQVVR